MDQALTSQEASRWRTLARRIDTAAVAAGAMLALLWSGSLTAHLDFAAVYVAFVLGITRGPQMLALRMLPSGFELFSDAVRACSVSVLLALGTGALLKFSTPVSLVTELWLVAIVTMGATRVAAALVGQRARRGGALMTPTLVVGAGFVGARVVRRLAEMPEYGLRPVGFLDADPLPGAIEMDDAAPVLGAPDDLAEVVSETGARHVILAFASERDHRLVELVNRCRELRLDVSVVPRLYESMNERVTLEHIGGLPLLVLNAVDPKGWQFAVKHTIDRVGAAIALTAVAPLMLAIAAAVRLGSPGPVIFRQRRVGRDGRVFEVLKFRTMRQEGASSFKARSGLAPGGIEGIDRRTPIGRRLRSTSLDELPQLINVLRGEMSIVGPRPERPEFVEQFAQEVHGYQHRHRVKSGITGWAQVNGLRGQTSIADRAEWDNHYIENWSLGLELRTIALTVAEVLRFRDGGPSTTADGSDALPQQAEPPLGLVPQNAAEATHPVWFCGYCGAPPVYSGAPAPVARVCGHCGQGLMLESHAEAAPRHGEAFLVVDSRLRVQALSQQAESVLGVPEQDATDRQLGELLVGADAEHALQESVVSILERAATGEDPPGSTFIRPRDTFGVRMRARIGACGPPRAVLIVLEAGAPVRAGSRHLRLVPDEARKAESA